MAIIQILLWGRLVAGSHIWNWGLAVSFLQLEMRCWLPKFNCWSSEILRMISWSFRLEVLLGTDWNSQIIRVSVLIVKELKGEVVRKSLRTLGISGINDWFECYETCFEMSVRKNINFIWMLWNAVLFGCHDVHLDLNITKHTFDWNV